MKDIKKLNKGNFTRNNWQIKKLGDVCDIVKDMPKEFSGERKYFSTGAVGNDYLDLPDNVTYKNRPSRANLYPKIGDVGFAKMKFTNKVLLINSDLNGSIFSTGFCFLRPSILLDSKYLFHFIISDEFQKTKDDYAGDGIMGGIKNSNIINIEIPIPSLSEQKRIVKILDEKMEKIRKIRKNVEENILKSNNLFESYLEKAFAGNEHSFTMKPLGSIATFRNGMNFTKTSKGELIKIVGVKDFQNNLWIPFENLESVVIDGKLDEIDLLKNGDILTVRSNGNPQLIGRTILANGISGKISHSGFTIRIRLNSKDMLPLYLCYYLKSKKVRDELTKSGTGINIKSLNQQSLTSLMIPVPETTLEQKLILEQLEKFSGKIETLKKKYQNKIFSIDELKRSLLNKVFSKNL